MKKYCILFIILLINNYLYCQQNILDKLVDISASNESIDTILKRISDNASVSFVYSADMVDLKQKVTLNCKEQSLKSVLNSLFQNTNVTYKIIGGQIILKQKQIIKRHIITGYLDDASTGERLIYASITNLNSNTSANSNLYGFYSISVPEGESEIFFSFVGYKTQSFQLKLIKDTTLNISLKPDTISMKEVIVVENPSLKNLQSTQTGFNSVKMQSLRELPSILGEKDLVKNLQTLPGVQASQEGSNGMFIRGGNADQNLFLLDGIPVYNINHLFGYFSVFNSDAMQNVSLYKSGFPARYGGRLSSIIDMKLKEGNSKYYEGKFTIGSLCTSAEFEGPIGKRASFYSSIRRTYLDLFTIPLMAYLNSKQKDSIQNTLEAGFSDFVGKVNYKLSEKSRLYLSIYVGNDHYGSSSFGGKLTDTSSIKWGNLTSALRWNYKISNRLFCNTTLTCSAFDFSVYAKYLGIDSFERKVDSRTNLSSGITDWALKSDFELYQSANHTIQFGMGDIIHNFKPGKVSSDNIIEEYKSNISLGKTISLSNEAMAYAEDEITITSRLKATAGLHLSMMNIKSNYDFSLQPRISTRYLLNKSWAVKASYARMTQYLHMISYSSSNLLALDIWVPVGQIVKPKHSNQIALGTIYSPSSNWEISAECFYKKMENLTEQKLENNNRNSLFDWSDTWSVGSGCVYGSELFIQKRTGRLTGWVNYTWSESYRNHQSIFGNVEYLQANAHKHVININLQFNLTPRFHFSALWSFGSGAMVSFPNQKYATIAPGMQYVYYINGINQYQLMPYHRLDLAMTYSKKKNRHESIWNFGLYNIYNQRNPNFIEIKEDKFIKYSYFSLIPSISYTLAFNTK